MIRERLAEVIEKYIIMDDVTMTDETEKFGTLALEGPAAAEVVRELTGICARRTTGIGAGGRLERGQFPAGS